MGQAGEHHRELLRRHACCHALGTVQEQLPRPHNIRHPMLVQVLLLPQQPPQPVEREGHLVPAKVDGLEFLGLRGFWSMHRTMQWRLMPDLPQSRHGFRPFVWMELLLTLV